MKLLLSFLLLLLATNSNKLLNRVRHLQDEQISQDDESDVEDSINIEVEEEPTVQPTKEPDSDMYDQGSLPDPNASSDQRTIYMTSFHALMNLGSDVNHYYNISTEKYGEDPAIVDNYKFKNDLERFSITKTMLEGIVDRKQEISIEVDKLYESIDYVEMTTEETLRFFDFLDRYKELTMISDNRSQEFELATKELQSIVSEYNIKMKGLLSGVYKLRNLELYINSLADPYKEDFMQEYDDTEKEEMAKQMGVVLTQFGNNFFNIFENMEKGLDYNDKFRDKLYDAVEKFREAPQSYGVEDSGSKIVHLINIMLIAFVLALY